MKLNILVVDDETPICDWLVYCIRRASADYVVDAATNGEEALEKILTQHPDLVITDIRMPKMDGLQLMRQTLEVLPFTTFVILTNYAEFGYAKEALSLGAKEYILKSEMRAVDVEKMLSSVLASKSTKINEKVDDVFQSGCIDLYNFYGKQDEPGFADRFWEHHGMQKAVPYRILAIPGGHGMEEWKETALWADSLRSAGGGQVYSVAASEKGIDYLVVQTEAQLDRWVDWLIGHVMRRGSVGLSSVIRDRSEFARGLRESACAQMAAFFFHETCAVSFEQICQRRPLQRETLRESRNQILTMLEQHRYQEAGPQIEAWFEQISLPSAEDVRWAVDYCRRMVLAVEEQHEREAAKSNQEMTIQVSLQDCHNRCREMLDDMQRSYTQRYSSSIAAALNYIHDNYDSHISMAETAKQVYRSPEYFSRQFKEEVGENFNTYLTLYRLDRAQELLDHTDLRIVEIAERVGYTTPGYFTRIYKKYKGITPEQARSGQNVKK